MYMTILIIFPKQFGENYKIGLVGVAISYILTFKILIKIILLISILCLTIFVSSVLYYKDEE